MSKVVPLGLRLFMEGVEIPVISASVNIQPDTPATAAIQVIPADSAMTLLPRTLVHLFFLDSSAFDDTSSEKDKYEVDPGRQPAEEQNDVNRFVAPDSFYKLLFSGQVIGLNYSKTPVSRQLVLQCMDLSINWDTCYQWFADYSVGGSALTDKSHNFVGAGQGLFDNVASGTKWVIGNILNSKPKSPEYQDSTGLLGGIIHLLESIGGLRRRSDGFEGYNGVNDFFTIAELRFNLLGMIGAVGKDKTSSKLYANKAFRSWLRNGMTSLGNLMSFRDILNHVNRYIYHTIYPNPVARYIEPKDKDALKPITVRASSFQKSTLGVSIVTNLKKVSANLSFARNAFIKADRVSQPVVEVSRGDTILISVLRDMDSLTQLSESLKTDDKRDVISSMKDITAKINDAHNFFVTKSPPPQFEGPGIAPSIAQPGGLLLYSSAANPIPRGELVRNSEKASGKVLEAINLVNGLLGKKQGKKRVNKKVTVPVGSHLFTQLILPETFFLSPPRCNVIFPDQYYTLSFSRNFLREVTRLSLQGGNGLLGGSRRGGNMLSRNYFSPNILDSKNKSLSVTTQSGSRIILPHEVHSGIIPKFEWVADGHRWGIKAAKQSGRTEELYKNAKVGYIQRLANFNFFLHRWKSRSIQLGGIFNPRLVAGFPAVVLDRAVPPPHVQDAIKKELGRNILPTQYLGKIATLNHNLNQGGGSTTVSMTHARTHRAFDDEFLGVLIQEAVARSAQFTEVIKPDQLQLQRTSYRKAYIRMLNYDQSGDLDKGTRIPELGARVFKVKKKGQFLMPIATAQSFGISTAFSGPAPTPTPDPNFVGPSEDPAPSEPNFVELPAFSVEDVVVLPEIMTVTLVKKTRDASIVSVAPEDLMMPGWYSDVWLKAKIGKDVYTPLLGTLAITDDVDINAKSQNELLQRWKNDVAEQSPSSETNLFPSVEGEPDVGEVITGSIEAAIDSIGILYGMLQNREDVNVHEFIERYTARPIANLREIMGSQNLEYNDTGDVADPETMDEGFHSRAFGDYNVDGEGGKDPSGGKAAEGGKPAMGALFPGLSEADIPKYRRQSLSNAKSKPAYIRPELDPRGRARARVKAYAAELKVSRGLLGG